jgi:TonB family protein
MIPRILVPIDARPTATVDAPTQRRRPTTMDERTLMSAMLPIVPLNGHSAIPTNLPLESIAARVVVPRDVNREAYSVMEDHSTPVQPTDMDERIAVPLGSAPPEMSAHPLRIPEDLVNPDIFITGEVNLTVPEHKEERAKARWQVTMRLLLAYSLLITLILLQSKLFPPHEPTQAEMELAQKQMTVLLPPGALESLKPSTRPVQPAPRVHVDPRVLRKVAPTYEPAPAPAPQPERPVRELPSAPVPKANAVPPDLQPSAPAPKTDAPKPALRLEAPDTPQPQHGLILPKNSASRSLQDTLRDAARSPSEGGRSGAVIGPMPRSRGALGGGGSQGGGGGSFGNGYEILTPTEGVDFSDYMARVIAAVRNNWYAVMPESAQLGDRGRVALQFRIMRNGSVPEGEPVRLIGSGKEPLDRAAISAIRSSNPFEPLPSAFSGPYIELRFYFLYNLPIEAAYQ